MTTHTATSAFQEAIEAVERLEPDDQAEVIELIRKRLIERQRTSLVDRVRQAREDYDAGNVWRGTAQELIARLDEDE
jgi:hypothetical protein